jgi:DNA-binding response OmpR family regulator
MAVRVLVIDDDRRLLELLTTFMTPNDVLLTGAFSGEAGLEELSRGSFDAVLLDVMMPGMDGLRVLRKIRERSSVPVIMLTARGDETDRVVGLELGADDYLPKPYSPRELLARLRAVLRRAAQGSHNEHLALGGLELSVEERSLRSGPISIELTGIEFDLLRALMQRPGRVVSRAALLELAGRADVSVGERSVDVHISKIRKKLEDTPHHAVVIKTIRGVGYQLTPRDAEDS